MSILVHQGLNLEPHIYKHYRESVCGGGGGGGGARKINK